VDRESRRRTRTPTSAGQALVEFALLAPAFVFLLLISVDCGRLFFSWVQVSNAAREAAAYASANPTDTTGITAHALQETNGQRQAGEQTLSVRSSCADPGGTTIDCLNAAGGSGTGNQVTVSVSERFSFLTPLVNTFFADNLTMSSSSTAAVFVLHANGGSTQPGACDAPTLASFVTSSSGLTVTVDASASTPNSGVCAISGYNWDWGDGLDAYPPITGKQASYTYVGARTYPITLQVTNQAGTLSTVQTVQMPAPTSSAPPTPSPVVPPTPSPSPSPICNTAPSFTYTEAGNSGRFNFFGAYTGQPAPAIWSWNYGDGTIDSGQAPPEHLYSGAGPYVAMLTVTNGSCQASYSQSVTP
jgi:Flp pilus assembly protein TadG